MTYYLKFDKSKPLSLHEIKEIFDNDVKLKEQKRKSKFKKHRHSKERKRK